MSSTRPISKAYRSTPIMMGVLIAIVAALVVTGSYTSLLGGRAYANIQLATSLLLNERDAYSLLIDMETGTRGYLITGDSQFLQPFNNASGQLPDLWSRLTGQISQLDEDATTKNNLTTLVNSAKSGAERWESDWAEKEIQLRGAGHIAEAMSTSANLAGEQMFGNVRQAIRQLDSALSVRLNSYITDLNNIRQTELVLVVGLGVLALASGLMIMRVSRRESQLQDEITGRVDIERQRLQAIIDNLPVGVRLVEVPGARVILQNGMAEELFPADEWNKLTPSQRVERYRVSRPDGTLFTVEETPVRRAFVEAKPIRDVELTMVTSERSKGRSGRKHHLLSSAMPLRDEQGKITSIVVVLQDVTRMREIDQRKDEFIATAAHELRNPLAALSGYNQLIQRLMAKGPANPAVIERNLGEMSHQITRLNDLVERLLDASRIQLGRLILDRSRQDLVKIARAVVGELRTADSGAHILTLTAPDELAGCWDAVRIEQVIANLLGNALRYTPHGSRVDVKLQRADYEARVEVIDEGPGISPAQRPHLFDRYYQTGSLSGEMLEGNESSASSVGGEATSQSRPSDSHRSQGLGLGLYISQEIISAHLGQIGVEANPEGGSIFWFTLPLGDC